MTGKMKAVFTLVVMIGLAAVVSAVTVGGWYRDVEVEEEPYEAGLRWDDERKRMSELGWHQQKTIIELGMGGASMTMDIRDKGGEPVALMEKDVSVNASRPAGDLDDIPCSTSVPRTGSISAECGALPFGHWDFIVIINTEKGPIKLVEKAYVEKRTR